MLGYGLMPYRPKSAKETTMWPLIALAAQKRHLSLYVCAVVDGGYIAETRADRLGKVSCGKSCIRFTSLDRVDTDELSLLVRDAVAATAAGSNAYSTGPAASSSITSASSVAPEVAVELPDRTEVAGRLQADQLVDVGSQPPRGLPRADRRREHDAGGTQRPRHRAGGPGRRAGGDPVVDDDRRSGR